MKSPLKFVRMDTDRFYDLKIRRLRHKHGCAGFCVYEYTLTEIYRDKGSYLEWTSESAFGVAEYWGLSLEEVGEIVATCAEIGLYDAGMLERGYLTSASIQRRYIEMCRAARRKTPEIPADVLLLDAEDFPQIAEDSPKIAEESQKTPQNRALKLKYKEKPPTGVKESAPPPEGGGVNSGGGRRSGRVPGAIAQPPQREEVCRYFQEEAARRGEKAGVALDPDKWEDFWLYYEQKEWHDGGGMNICSTWRSAASRWVIEEIRRAKRTKSTSDYEQSRDSARRGVTPTGREQYRDTL